MKSITCKDRIYMDKEGVSPQMTSDLWLGLSEQADTREEEVDPLVEEDVWVDHQACQEDRWMDHLEETTTTKIGMISRETMKATT